jgi:transposase
MCRPQNHLRGLARYERVCSRLSLGTGLSRGNLTEAEWRILKGLLPIELNNRRRGRLPEQNPSIINGILWQLRCGAPWRDVPPKQERWNTIYRRIRRQSEAGVWQIVVVTLAEIMADICRYSTDSTTVRAHVSQRTEKGDSSTGSWPLGDGSTLKLHCMADAPPADRPTPT